MTYVEATRVCLHFKGFLHTFAKNKTLILRSAAIFEIWIF